MPGLTRTHADFAVLAAALSSDPVQPRLVYALDYRGRGLSDYASDPAQYNVVTELGDLMVVLGALNIGKAVFIGTSRGGILTMLLAQAAPQFIAGSVLNDIGPVLEIDGLMRIKGYVGRLPPPRDFAHAAEILRGEFGSQFPALTDADWLAWAQRSYKREANVLKQTYDRRLSDTLGSLTKDTVVPDMWAQFDALARCGPLLCIRGELSDLLSTATAIAMKARQRSIETIEIARQGHAPLLAEREVFKKISTFAVTCDRRLQT